MIEDPKKRKLLSETLLFLDEWQGLLSNTKIHWWSSKTYAECVQDWTESKDLKSQKALIYQKIQEYESRHWFIKAFIWLFGDIVYQKRWFFYQTMLDQLGITQTEKKDSDATFIYDPALSFNKMWLFAFRPLNLPSLPNTWKILIEKIKQNLSALFSDENNRLIEIQKNYDIQLKDYEDKMRNNADFEQKKGKSYFIPLEILTNALDEAKGIPSFLFYNVTSIFQPKTVSSEKKPTVLEPKKTFVRICGILGLPLSSKIADLKKGYQEYFEKMGHAVAQWNPRDFLNWLNIETIKSYICSTLVKDEKILQGMPNVEPSNRDLESKALYSEYFSALFEHMKIKSLLKKVELLKFQSNPTAALTQEIEGVESKNLDDKKDEGYLQQALEHAFVFGFLVLHTENFPSFPSASVLKARYTVWKQKHPLLKECEDWLIFIEDKIQKLTDIPDTIIKDHQEVLGMVFEMGKDKERELNAIYKKNKELLCKRLAMYCGILGFSSYQLNEQKIQEDKTTILQNAANNLLKEHLTTLNNYQNKGNKDLVRKNDTYFKKLQERGVQILEMKEDLDQIFLTLNNVFPKLKKTEACDEAFDIGRKIRTEVILVTHQLSIILPKPSGIDPMTKNSNFYIIMENLVRYWIWTPYKKLVVLRLIHAIEI